MGWAEQQDQRARHTIFSKCWYKTWSNMLKIQEVAQHARSETARTAPQGGQEQHQC